MVAGTYLGNVQIWNLKKPKLMDSFDFDPENKMENKKPKASKNKIRSINFTIDERYVVISNKQKLAYYSTLYLKEEKSKSVFDNFNIEYYVRKIVKDF